MKRTILFLASLFILLTTVVKAQDEAMMKAWQEFATPGEMHKMMGTWSGTWTVDVQAWMDPKAPPEKSTATAENKILFSGLYLVGSYTGTMMGSPFEGRSVLAYDNAKKMFVNTWIDNMGSGIVIMTGKWNDKTKTLELSGTQSDPMTGKESPIREDIQVIDANTQKMSLYGPGMDKKEMKFMEMTMKRKI